MHYRLRRVRPSGHATEYHNRIDLGNLTSKGRFRISNVRASWLLTIEVPVAQRMATAVKLAAFAIRKRLLSCANNEIAISSQIAVKGDDIKSRAFSKRTKHNIFTSHRV